ncbi:MAG TPA: PEP-utilizing enzyme [Gaiellales bacterium]|jgi:phosphohistidine swiveling domain-containing protein|nr:PEP-utilizing enzyme [Gaiellales bacterium]
MTNAETVPELRFEPPSPGYWERDAVHFPRPMTRYWQEVHPAAFARGTGDFARFYGMLIDSLGSAYVHGFGYRSMVPVSEDEVPARFQRASEVMQGKLWREQLRNWDETVKPDSIRAHRALQSVDPGGLSDQELVEYLTRCRDHHAAMIAQHMRHTASAVVPTGDLLAHVGDWTDVPPAEVLGLMRGASPVSAGASAELERLIAAFEADPQARELLASDDDPGQVLAQLRAIDGETGEAVSGYLDLVGYRLLDGFDISEPYALAMPDALVRAIRIAVAGRDLEGADVEAAVADIRGKVPEQHRAEFDELLGEARLTYRLRDERGVFSDIWASGLMRRAVLEGGRRVAARGQIHEPVHLIDAGFDEMCSLVSDGSGPSADELAARAAERASRAGTATPRSLGDPPPPPPDASGLPPDVARLMRATGLALGHLFGSSEAEHDEQVLRGLAASPGVYEGPARLISGPSEFDRIVNGDVLVTQSTTEAFNILLPLLGAIVTDSGGLLSHSAIVAREYGIPGVVGTREATGRIADGTRVRVDGDAGEVTVLE